MFSIFNPKISMIFMKLNGVYSVSLVLFVITLSRWAVGTLNVSCLTPSQPRRSFQGGAALTLTCATHETEVAAQASCLTQSQYTDTGPTSPSANPIMPDARRGSH